MRMKDEEALMKASQGRVDQDQLDAERYRRHRAHVMAQLPVSISTEEFDAHWDAELESIEKNLQEKKEKP